VVIGLDALKQPDCPIFGRCPSPLRGERRWHILLTGEAALVSRNPESQTVSLTLDATASMAIFAIAAYADEREARIREVQR
jgi:hypothetical protein